MNAELAIAFEIPGKSVPGLVAPAIALAVFLHEKRTFRSAIPSALWPNSIVVFSSSTLLSCDALLSPKIRAAPDELEVPFFAKAQFANRHQRVLNPEPKTIAL